MAEVYFGQSGDDSTGDGSAGNPYRSRDEAVTNGVAGTDELVLLDGTNSVADAAGYWNLNDDFLHRAQTPRGAILTSSNATWVARTSSGLSAATNPFIVRGIIFDGENGRQDTFEFGEDSSEDLITRLEDCEIKNGTTRCVRNRMERGRQELIRCKISGDQASSFYSTGSLSANDSDQTIIINDLEFDITLSGSGDDGIYIEKVNNLTNTFDVKIKNVFGVITVPSDIATNAIYVYGVSAPVISDCNFTMTAPDTASSTNVAIYVRAKATATTTAADVLNNKIRFFSPGGYAIWGTDGSAGLCSGNEVIGKYYSTATPHLYGFFGSTEWDVKSNVAWEGYVGYLASETTTCDLIGNTAFDCFGPSYYVKGATAAIIRNNVAVVTDQFTQRDNGIIAVSPQNGTDTTSATVEDNIIIIEDVSKIHSIFQIEDANQTCTYARNVIYLPDTVNLATTDLFCYQSGTPNNTYSEWIAQTEVTDDVIIPLPIADIRKLIEEHAPVGWHWRENQKRLQQSRNWGITSYGEYWKV